MSAPVLTRPLLAQPAPVAIRWMARAFLQRVLEAAPRVEIRTGEVLGTTVTRDRQPDLEAVHDFRVALRRLRAWLRLWRPELQPAHVGRAERELRRISNLAGIARDLEVERDWLLSPRIQRSREAGASARAQLEALEPEYERALRALATALFEELSPAAARLDAALTPPPATKGHPGPTMAAAIADRLAVQAEKLPRQLRRVRREDQMAEAHRARITAKRLRYLVDTLAPVSGDARTVSRYLARLQDVLGELHDAQVMLERSRAASRAKGTRHGRRKAEDPSAMRELLERRVAARFASAQRIMQGVGPARAAGATERLIAMLWQVEAR